MKTQERELYEHMSQNNNMIAPSSTRTNSANTNVEKVSSHQRQFLNMVRSMIFFWQICIYYFTTRCQNPPKTVSALRLYTRRCTLTMLGSLIERKHTCAK